MKPETLLLENQLFENTDRVSTHNFEHGFSPAFQDSATGHVYLSRYTDGQPAPFHLLDGLPNELVTARDAEGRIIAVKQTIIAGFVLAERFYTREEAEQHSMSRQIRVQSQS